ncbi:TadE/TadG family type IV pilus assembly protein [Rhizobium rosettiformans]|uniref:TadE/TadG family type IV pilus assembly protein n=1 Tax=Rhizobium rosettiformans TaxID=1368430 RepID=UPI00285E432D|nr:pilus assembly protein [Rhizobium rosettiformans]MDR7028108.1 Flp pilus assembly protein TadG [Rhizobium rosettiformans]MDR7064610.1 Flp pilus assembly protein TadG [Rhizobium rosettiformans]
MTSQTNDRNHRNERVRGPRFRLWRKLVRSSDGAAAIEFAILAVPYFLIVFAIIETFVAFAAEQLVTNAVNTLGRELRTGQITYNLNRSTTDMDITKFRRAFCEEVNIMIQCSEEEIATPNKLYIDARTFTSFAAIPKTIPRKSTAAYSDIDPTSFKFTPGGPSSINMLRAYYRWQVITDLVRPFITTIRPADGSMPSDFLIVATTAFQNENYP